MKLDKKASKDEITFVVPVDKKKVEIISLTSEEVFKMLKQ
jgi:hypothetical protein